MYRYPTLQDLRTIKGQLPPEQQRIIVNKAAARSASGSTFLSHSSQDVEHLPAVIALLEQHGGSVYLDKKDQTLPPYTSHETARLLRQRIAECRTFLLFATTLSKESRWMPWELGLSDGIKSGDRTAVFPAVDSENDTNWTLREYLGAYDRLVFGDLEGYSAKVWMILNQARNTAMELSRWLKG